MPLTTSVPVSYVYVADRARALGFYRDTLGLPVRGSDDQGDFIEVGDGLVRLTPADNHQPGEHPVMGFDVRDLDIELEALRGRGVAFTALGGDEQAPQYVWSAPDGGPKVAFFADSEGNLLTLSQI